jgi:glucosamine--fructose-6-phosphate aminotransferase (isomerizing)
VRICDAQDHVVERAITQTALSGAMIGKAGYRHFMLKEIFEQPGVIGDTLASFIDPKTQNVNLPPLPFDWKNVSRLTIVACGTAYIAGVVAKYWFEQVARLNVEVDIASEFRYRAAPMPKDGAMIVISQSGETADTLAALHYGKSQGQKILAILNVPTSSMARAADGIIATLAGPEIGVASTKAFTTQLVTLACLVLDCAVKRGSVNDARAKEMVQALFEVPAHINTILHQQQKIQDLSHTLAEVKDVLYLGRGINYPIAMEGALKLKEISYIHAEAYPAGELKHGPLALVDDDMPVIAVAPRNDLLEKLKSNLEEVRARGGQLYIFADSQVTVSTHPAIHVMRLPAVHEAVAPVVYTVPLQLLAYHVAVLKGADVDQPRNLAKSVTVE